MKKSIISEPFEEGAASFFSDVATLLANRSGVQLSCLSLPQNLACYQVNGVGSGLQLRLVLIPFADGGLLGRVSWLDCQGVDHVCCYVNEAFDSLVMTSGGMWKKQKTSAEALCLQGFDRLAA